MSINAGLKDTSKLACSGGTPVRATWLAYGRQSISDEDVNAVVKVLKSDWLTQGPNIGDFEESVSEYIGVAHAVAVNSGTAALHAAYFAAGIQAGDEIIMPAMSFAATANAALYLGAKPVFADIEPDTGNIDANSVRANKRTKAIVCVDYAGQPCDMGALRELAEQAGIPLIVDGAHSLGALYDGKPSQRLADLTTLSFHPVKLITTGEGGMIVTANEEYASRLKRFRTHGIEKNEAKLIKRNVGPWYHEMQDLGFNYRITDFQAVLGTSQMKRLQAFVARRREIAQIYRTRLSQLASFTCLIERTNRQSAYHLFPVLVNVEPYAEMRKFVVEALHAENIGVQVHYIPIYDHPYYTRKVNKVRPDCPRTDQFYNRVLSLPIFPDMTDEDVDDVIQALTKIDAVL